MSEEAATTSQAPDTSAGAGLAMEIALDEAREDPQLRGVVGEFLATQNRIASIQAHHLPKQLALHHWEQRLGVLLRVATAFTGMALAAGLALMVWGAAHSRQLVIEPFSVPPDLAARGLTGEVIAARVLDEVRQMQEQTTSYRAAQTYANNWEKKDLKVELPETGVSLDELDQFLRTRLGHDIHVSGELVRQGAGISLTVRAGESGARNAAGTEADLDAVVQKAAEGLYSLTQPYRYAVYLRQHGRFAESIALAVELSRTGPAQERAWAISLLAGQNRDVFATASLNRQGVALDPQNSLLWGNLSNAENRLGQTEAAFRDTQQALKTLGAKDHGRVSLESVPTNTLVYQSRVASLRGDYGEAARLYRQGIDNGFSSSTGKSGALALYLAQSHDLAGARAVLRDPIDDSLGDPGIYALTLLQGQITLDTLAEDLPALTNDLGRYREWVKQYPDLSDLSKRPYQASFLARAEAMLGALAQAETDIAVTPADCVPCLITRAQIAELQTDRSKADDRFARAVKLSPSLPIANAEWGKVLLARGDPDGAIARFSLASQQGPHFADPLEMWGEALIAQGKPQLALAKFAQAAQYAPNWGRLQLKWGEALLAAGQASEARAKFARAAELELTPAEAAKLAKVRG